MPNDLKSMVLLWAEHVGPHKAHARLVNCKLSSSLVQKLISGKYKSQPNALVSSVLRREMAKDGFRLAGEKAS